MRYYLIEKALIEDEFGSSEEAYYVGEWNENILSAEDDFHLATRWYVTENEDIWIVNTKDGRFREATEKEDAECREYIAPLGNVRRYL